LRTLWPPPSPASAASFSRPKSFSREPPASATFALAGGSRLNGGRTMSTYLDERRVARQTPWYAWVSVLLTMLILMAVVVGGGWWYLKHTGLFRSASADGPAEPRAVTPRGEL